MIGPGTRICLDSTKVESIIPSFMHTLAENLPLMYQEVMKSIPPEFVDENGEFRALALDDVLWKTDQLFWWFHEDLWEAMEKMEPVGCHFGTRVLADGIWFGYWSDTFARKEVAG